MSVIVKFLASLEKFIGIDQLSIEFDTAYFTLQDLFQKLAPIIGAKLNYLITEDPMTLKPEILVFINNKECQALQELKTPLFDGTQVTFLSTIHGGSNSFR
ncbi:MAG: hypothetical protein EU536_01960 [Promethearchaeota archaeon]|nr:MAG: hypothetical protein EU536_01960 [Candidatus Lokiarchaeota archaeon]